jgi:hypothetical protein
MATSANSSFRVAGDEVSGAISDDDSMHPPRALRAHVLSIAQSAAAVHFPKLFQVCNPGEIRCDREP